MNHISVLLEESIDGLKVRPSGTYLDATFGGGGHTKAICHASGKTAHIIAIDADDQAIKRAEDLEFRKLMTCPFSIHHANFGDLDEVLDAAKAKTIDGALFDLGTSSFQIGASGKGFSFQEDEPLLMRFGRAARSDGALAHVNAKDIVNEFSEESIADIIFGFGEERFSRRIAKAIVARREIQPFETTKDLAEVVTEAYPSIARRTSRTHPATRTFQALRIAVNNELDNLKIGLQKAFERLAPQGRLCVISFHSLEDRIVKRFCVAAIAQGEAKAITKKPTIPTSEEITKNPRARSAKLRIIEKL